MARDAVSKGSGQTAGVARVESTPVFSVTFKDSAYDALKELSSRTGKPIEQIIQDAIVLQKWYTDISSEGGRLMVEKGGKVQPVVFRATASS